MAACQQSNLATTVASKEFASFLMVQNVMNGNILGASATLDLISVIFSSAESVFKDRFKKIIVKFICDTHDFESGEIENY